MSPTEGQNSRKELIGISDQKETTTTDTAVAKEEDKEEEQHWFSWIWEEEPASGAPRRKGKQVLLKNPHSRNFMLGAMILISRTT